MTPAPINRDLLLLEPGTVHLLSGGEAPVTHASIAAYATYARDKSTGGPGRQRLEATVERVRDRLAAFVGTKRDNVGFVNSASGALTAAVMAFDWRAGDSVVTLADEYPSVVLAGLGLERFGVDVHLVEAGNDPLSAVLDAIRPGTRLVLVSQVDFRYGRRLDIAALATELHRRGVALGVDASHALGVLPVPVNECGFVVSCGHKFLLGAHGTGILIWNTDRLGQPHASAGWFSVANFAVKGGAAAFTRKPGALSFELGNPDFPALYALEAGLGILEASGGLTSISSYALELSSLLRERLAAAGWEVMTPEAGRGTSIAIRSDAPEAVAARLAADRIHVAAGEGRLRLSIHGFNTAADIDAALAKLGAP